MDKDRFKRVYDNYKKSNKARKAIHNLTHYSFKSLPKKDKKVHVITPEEAKKYEDLDETKDELETDK